MKKMDASTRNRIIEGLIAEGYSLKEAIEEVEEMEVRDE